MLSILIPCFNWDCSKLVADLYRQCILCSSQFEIIVCDDCSSDKDIINSNSKIENLAGCFFIELDKNIGRAAIRNLLAEKSHYDTLLFIDCDAEVRSHDFIEKYIQAGKQSSVVCGGLVHPDMPPALGHELRYKYEKKADKKRSAKFRRISPYSHFSTFSFMIKRDIFFEIGFDEQFVQYGYEDVLFGIRLKEKNITIEHIDNPLTHTGIENNEIFLKKTETAIKTLSDMHGEFNDDTTLLKWYSSADKLHLCGALNLIWMVFNKLMQKNLTGHRPSIFVFSVYKVSLFAHLNR